MGAVGRHPPQGFGAVEEVLYQGVRAAPVPGGPVVKALVEGDDVDGGGGLAAVDPVRDGELVPARFDRRPLVLEGREAEQLEELGGPVLPGEGGAAFPRPLEPPGEGVPVDPRVGKGPLYFVGEASAPAQSEVGGALPLDVGAALADPFDQIG